MPVSPENATWARRSLAAALLVGILAIVAAGCGGSGSSGATLRKRLEAGVAKLHGAPSYRASILYQVESEETPPEPGQGPCLNVSVDRRRQPLRVELLSFDQSCEGGSGAQEVVIIGNRAWLSNNQPEHWAAAKLAADVPGQVTDGEVEFKLLLDDASEIERAGTGAYSTPAGDFEEGPQISFVAPADSFSRVKGAASTDVDFTALLDRDGYLRELTATVEEDGEGAVVTQTYEDIGGPQEIEPPPRDEVFGPVAEISSRKQLEALMDTAGSGS